MWGKQEDESSGNDKVRDPNESARRAAEQGSRYLWIAAAVLLAFYLFTDPQGDPGTRLTYSEFLSAVDQGDVAEVTLRGQEITGRFTEDAVDARDDVSFRPFRTLRPTIADDALLERLQANDVQVDAAPTEPAWWLQILIEALPWVLALGLLFWFWNRMAQRAMTQGGGMFGIGQSRARKVQGQSSDVSMKHVAGLDNAKREVTEVIEFLKEPGRFRTLGAHVPRGLLLQGPPGTGKTLLARAVAGEADVPFFSVTGSEFIEMFVGVGASRVRDMFKQARSSAPSVIFIDELDAIGRRRGAGMGGGHDEREQTLNQILAQMDGFDPHEAVVVMGATNRPDVLDPALLRPGRFDRKISVDRPDRKARAEILKVHTEDMPLADDVDLDHLARTTVGFSGADLANLANEAALLAGRHRKDHVDWACFTEARDRIMLGQARDSALSEREKKVVAYHESGHALLAHVLPNADPVDKITVIPRSQSLGATAQMPTEDRYNYGESYLRDRIAVMFGGRLAESIVFGEGSNGAANDLAEATRLARSMVSSWGMSEKLAPAAFAEGDGQVFLGKEMATEHERSDRTSAIIDAEIRRLLRDIEQHAREQLENHRDRLDELAEALQEHETLEADEVAEILDRERND